MAVPGRCSVAFAVAFCQCRPRARRAAQTPEARPPRTAGHAPQAQVAGGQDTPRPIDPAATPPRRIGHTQLSANGTQSPISLNSYHVSYDYLIIQNGPFNPLLSGRARHSIMIHGPRCRVSRSGRVRARISTSFINVHKDTARTCTLHAV